MDVDPSVIKDHGDIWNLSFVEMLAQLMAPRGFFEPGGGTRFSCALLLRRRNRSSDGSIITLVM